MIYRIFFITIPFCLSGCVMLGTNWIHSPSSDIGIPTKHHHIHGGAIKNSPPDAITIPLEDSVQIVINAQTISEKKNFGGIIIPIFPLFWIPKINFYGDQPNTLIVNLTSNNLLPNSNNIIELNTGSAKVISNDQVYLIHHIKKTEFKNHWELQFPLEAKKTDEFELSDIEVILNEKQEVLPTVKFRKMKQKWLFIGP